MSRFKCVGAALLVACCTGSILKADPTIQTTYNKTTRTIVMKDLLNGAVIINPVPGPGGEVKKVYDTSGDFATGEVPLEVDDDDIHFKATDDGYDLEVVVRNNGETAGRAGSLWVSNIAFGQQTYHRDFDYFNFGDHETSARWSDDPENHNYFTGTSVYPDGCYAPVAVVRGFVTVPPGPPPAETPPLAEYALGISFQYPVLDYDVSVHKEYQAFNSQWRFGFYVNPKHTDPAAYNAAGNVPAHGSRTYKYSVRVLRNPSSYPEMPAQWLRTLEPYRKYFQETYGAPRYVPDYRPVLGVATGLDSNVVEGEGGNPFGFDPRFDQTGWQPRVADLDEQRSTNHWQRHMIWAPSGYVPHSWGTNYRYEFATHMSAIPMMASTQPYLTDFSVREGGFGLWWGHSVEVMKNWANSTPKLMDPADSDDRAAAFAELNAARLAGATEIGLDQYILKRRAAYTWLTEMKLRYPELRFCSESFRPDYIHLLCANFKQIGPTDDTGTPYELGTDHSTCAPQIRPLALPDFLLQRHETWGAAQPTWINKNDCLPASDWHSLNTTALAYWPGYIALQGYTPLIYGLGFTQRQPLDPSVIGHASFTESVPLDLQTPYCPLITTQPTTQVAGISGNPVTISAAAFSPRGKALSYQWYFRKFSTTPETDVPMDQLNGLLIPCSGSGYTGTTTDTLTINFSCANAGSYCMRVKESDGGATWSSFTRVFPMADINRDGSVDFFDYLDFTDFFYSPLKDPRADVNKDGVIDFFDYLDFTDAFSAGCP